ncbi:MAG: DUF3168 domain-containing protein [Beijerinckiaceae bacterium]
MTSPIVALKQAVATHLGGSAPLVALLKGANKIHADPPRHAAFPHLAFVAAETRENGTSSDDGHVIDLTFAAFTRHTGSAEALEIVAAVETALRTMPATLTGHRLVNLITRAAEPIVLKDGESWRALLRIRAVTEVV